MSAPTYLEETIHRNRLEHDQYLASNRTVLSTVPKFPFANFLLIAYLMLPQRPSLPLRSTVFILILLISISSLQTDRTTGLVHGVLIGVSSTWCIVSAFNFLFLYDHAKDFQRLVDTSGGTTDVAYAKEKTTQDRGQWESMPKSLSRRLFWVLDLLGSLSCLHWSHGDISSSTPIKPRRPNPPKPRSLPQKFWQLLLMYLAINLLKDLMALDPYFWGSTNSPIPTTHPFSFSILPAPLIHLYRLSVCFAVIYIGVEWPATAGSVVCINILGPGLIGPWGHEWAHRRPLGAFSSIAQRGLKGWWGDWWHQWFRWTVTSPATALVHALQLHPTSPAAKAIRTTLPFLLSGLIHAGGNYTLWGPTQPQNAFLFFAVQPVGIAVQDLSHSALTRLGLIAHIPVPVRRAANVTFTGLWLLYSFPWLADDFVRGGMYLTEPFAAFSVLPMLGVGGVGF